MPTRKRTRTPVFLDWYESKNIYFEQKKNPFGTGVGNEAYTAKILLVFRLTKRLRFDALEPTTNRRKKKRETEEASTNQSLKNNDESLLCQNNYKYPLFISPLFFLSRSG